MEEKLVGGVPDPKVRPLIDELLEAGTVMHADIDIAPSQHRIIAAVCAIRVTQSIIFPCTDFANRPPIRPGYACRIAPTWSAGVHRANLRRQGCILR